MHLHSAGFLCALAGFSNGMATEVALDFLGLLGALQALSQRLQFASLMEQGRPSEKDSAYT